MSVDPETVRRVREEVLSLADLTACCAWGDRVPNEINDELNQAATPHAEDALNFVSQLVARALIARGILHVAADWWSSLPGAPRRELCLAVLQSIVDELPEGVRGGSFIPMEKAH